MNSNLRTRHFRFFSSPRLYLSLFRRSTRIVFNFLKINNAIVSRLRKTLTHSRDLINFSFSRLSFRRAVEAPDECETNFPSLCDVERWSTMRRERCMSLLNVEEKRRVFEGKLWRRLWIALVSFTRGPFAHLFLRIYVLFISRWSIDPVSTC